MEPYRIRNPLGTPSLIIRTYSVARQAVAINDILYSWVSVFCVYVFQNMEQIVYKCRV